MQKKVIILNSQEFDSGSFFDRRERQIREHAEEKKSHYKLMKDERKIEKKKEKETQKASGIFLKPEKKSKMYFTEETEDAIVRYCAETDLNARGVIFENELKYPFNKMAENIINTFSFSYIPESYEDIKAEVVSHMLLNVYKYQKCKGKAFSYFSIMVKNYLIISNNQHYAELKAHYSLQTEQKGDNIEFDIIDDTHHNNEYNQDNSEFIKILIEYWEKTIPSTFKKRRDIDIATAVVELLKNVQSLEYFNKKALYLLIRELTGHKTQYITRVLSKMQKSYDTVKSSYFNIGTYEEEPFF